jgi:hypothetical protein
VALPLSYPAGGAAARRLLDFNALDDPPEISNVQWEWLEVRPACKQPSCACILTRTCMRAV